mgnify:CR=1 FL=1
MSEDRAEARALMVKLVNGFITQLHGFISEHKNSPHLGPDVLIGAVAFFTARAVMDLDTPPEIFIRVLADAFEANADPAVVQTMQ